MQQFDELVGVVVGLDLLAVGEVEDADVVHDVANADHRVGPDPHGRLEAFAEVGVPAFEVDEGVLAGGGHGGLLRDRRSRGRRWHSPSDYSWHSTAVLQWAECVIVKRGKGPEILTRMKSHHWKRVAMLRALAVSSWQQPALLPSQNTSSSLVPINDLTRGYLW